MATQDHARAIIASLFSSPPGSSAPPNDSYVAHCPTWEIAPPVNAQPGQATQIKARFLILSGGQQTTPSSRDGRLKLHKAKQNSNGTFSIGKTWPLEHLSQVEVAKRMVEGYPNPQPLEFVLTIAGKAYRYKTNMPSSQQAAFLVTVVRCWRRFMNGELQPCNDEMRADTSCHPFVPGRGQPDLVLLGFAVDNSQASTFVPSPHLGGQQQLPLNPRTRTPSGPSPGHEIHRPGSSASNVSAGGGRRPVQQGHSSPVPMPPVQAAMMMAPSNTSAPLAPGPGPGGPRSRDPSIQSNYRMDAPPPPTTSSSTPSFQNSFGGPPLAPTARRPSSPSSRPSPLASSSSVPPTAIGTTTSIPRRPSGQPPPMSSSSTSMSAAAAAAAARSSSQKLEIRAKLGERKRSVAAQGLKISSGAANQAVGVGPKGGLGARTPTNPPGAMQPGSATSMNFRLGGKGVGSAGTSASAMTGPGPGKKGKSADEIVDDETVLMNVEEMLQGFEWRGAGVGTSSGAGGEGSASFGSMGVRRHGAARADEIEKRLIGELKALDAASIHAIMESDDRVEDVVKCLDQTLAELEVLELTMGMYKTQLNLMTDDIAHIESQNRGLQVQTSNQRQLLSEIDNLMSTIHIPEEDLAALAQESLESTSGIERLEKAAVSLYKALLSTRDTEMLVASERVAEYRATATRFSKRVLDFLTIMFKFQVDGVLHPKDVKMKKEGRLPGHEQLEEFLGRYCGIMLFVKEIEFERYEEICSVSELRHPATFERGWRAHLFRNPFSMIAQTYHSVMSDLYLSEIQELLTSFKAQIRRISEEELEAMHFTSKESPTLRQQSIRRAGTLVSRSPADGGRKREESNGSKEAKMSASEAFGRALEQIVPHVQREQGFLADFLHVNSLDASITFADYMMLETFFRRGATQHLNQNFAKMKDIKGSMELVFKFLENELKEWTEGVLRLDPMQIVGVVATLDRFILQCEAERIEFLLRLLQRQHSKSISTLERQIKEQIKGIEQTKLTLKKRKGVVPFVRVFPNFVERIEAQLEGCDDLPIRDVVDAHYERVTATMFDCLQQMAKMDGEAQGGEGKDQLNYHVILIENMHHIIAVFSKQQRVLALEPFIAQAKEKYTQNLDAYIRIILRRPLARVLVGYRCLVYAWAVDFFTGLEQLLRTTPPNEVSLHSAYTRASVRRALSDLRAKDVRKAVDGLYKRVDKHFGVEVSHQAAQHSEVLKTVWKACEEEMLRMSGAWRALLERCYSDDKVGLDFSATDVSEFFRKAQSACVRS
ncbi:BQ2448_1938 [Microbotryum intermedium]|uniref:BQ2448_1938 protein n=1 Tax=Microbotryum intermedium TaxID=269621 RepID=A0A238FCQ1_9BASI|nr:BQ2448_1938 [Microbotryum intermedium]